MIALPARKRYRGVTLFIALCEAETMRLRQTIFLLPILAASLAAQTPSSTPPDASPSANQPAPPLRKVGGSVLPPVVLFAPEPHFSEQATKAKVGGTVLVGLEIDTDGNPQHVHVIRGIGMGLDEKAIEAVRLYRFKPATENGNPVPVTINIAVNFQVLRDR
jgi:TonB family protein